MEDYERLRAAADKTRKAWNPKGWTSSDGTKGCAVQNIYEQYRHQWDPLDGAGFAYERLPDEIINGMIRYLKTRYPIGYMLNQLKIRMLGANISWRRDPTLIVQAWNDSLFRRQSQVARMFDYLADEFEARYKADRLPQLEQRIRQLETERALLLERIGILEKENRSLKARLLGQQDMLNVIEQLRALDEELDEKYAEMGKEVVN